MIDPTKVTNFSRTDEELEEFLLFCICVAGKTASQISIALDKFMQGSESPFLHIKQLSKNNVLRKTIIKSGLGQYNKLTRAFEELTNEDIDLRTCSPEQLETIHGIGPKTSRYFILHSRKNANVACLDTHIRRYMREELGVDTPSTPPHGKKYRELESIFLSHAKEINRDPADLDLEIWNRYSSRSGAG